MINKSTKQYNPYWMWRVSFLKIKRIILYLEKQLPGFRNRDFNSDEKIKDILLKDTEKKKVSNTTLYHYLNTIYHLEILKKDNHYYYLNLKNPDVLKILESRNDSELENTDKICFSKLILQNPDCWNTFFRLFYLNKNQTKEIDQFISNSAPVSINFVKGEKEELPRITITKGQKKLRVVRLQNITNKKTVELNTYRKINAIMWGLRLWGKELGFLDELTIPEKGILMSPVYLQATIDEVYNQILKQILDRVMNDDNQWVYIRVIEFQKNIFKNYKYPVYLINKSILKFLESNKKVALPIYSADTWFHILAKTGKQEDLFMKNILKMPGGGYISHLKIHKDILKQEFINE